MKKNISQKGFTLVELIVSLGLFTIVVVAVVSSLYTVNAAYKRVSAMRETLDNLNFAIESIVRNVHTGTEIVCNGESAIRPTSDGVNCSATAGIGSNKISLKSTLGDKQLIEYYLANKSIMRRTAPLSCDVVTGICQRSGEFSAPIQLTAPQIEIQQLTFYVDGATKADLEQPRVVMRVKGIASAITATGTNPGSFLPFYLQTLISQRSFE